MKRKAKSTETQSQKYNGNNNFNNAITIDFEEKSVRFEPIKAKMKWWSMYATWGYMLAVITFMLLLIMSFIAIWYLNLLGQLNRFDLPIFFVVSYFYSQLVRWLSPLIFSINYFKNNFPMINAYTLIIFEMLTSYKNPVHKGKVNPKVIENNKFIISDFRNVYMDYKFTEDFAKYIKKIDVVNLYTDNPYKWRAEFHFSKQPKKGEFYIKYV